MVGEIAWPQVRPATYTTAYGAQTGLFVPERGNLFVATGHQTTGQSGEILNYETK